MLFAVWIGDQEFINTNFKGVSIFHVLCLSLLLNWKVTQLRYNTKQ